MPCYVIIMRYNQTFKHQHISHFVSIFLLSYLICLTRNRIDNQIPIFHGYRYFIWAGELFTTVSLVSLLPTNLLHSRQMNFICARPVFESSYCHICLTIFVFYWPLAWSPHQHYRRFRTCPCYDLSTLICFSAVSVGQIVKTFHF